MYLQEAKINLGKFADGVLKKIKPASKFEGPKFTKSVMDKINKLKESNVLECGCMETCECGNSKVSKNPKGKAILAKNGDMIIDKKPKEKPVSEGGGKFGKLLKLGTAGAALYGGAKVADKEVTAKNVTFKNEAYYEDESENFNEGAIKDTLIGAAAGTAVGGTAQYVKYRLESKQLFKDLEKLKKKYDRCETPTCRDMIKVEIQEVQDKIDTLKQRGISNTALSGIGGGTVGLVAGAPFRAIGV